MTLILRILLFISFLFLLQQSRAQKFPFTISECVKMLSDGNDKENASTKKIVSWLVYNVDSSQGVAFLNNLWENRRSGNLFFEPRYLCIRQQFIINKINPAYLNDYKTRWLPEITRAMNLAYKSGDQALIAFVSSQYASIASRFNETGLAVMYMVNSTSLYEQLNIKSSPGNYQLLAELLYKIREYRKSLEYAKKAVEVGKQSKNEFFFIVSCVNTIALGYHRLKLYDSAFIFYNQALELSKKLPDSSWRGFVLGNMGQIYYEQKKYDTALALLYKDAAFSRAGKYYDDAGNAMQWAAKTHLALGNTNKALDDVRTAFNLLKLWPDANYQKNACYTATQIFKARGEYDSAFYYNNCYSELNDSLEKVINTSSISISQARLNDETSKYNIQKLRQEKDAQLMQRNILIGGILILCLLALMVISRQRLKSKMKMEKVIQEKKLMEQDIASAKEQLKLFTEKIIEKTTLIEKLESQVNHQQISASQQSLISELSQQTILTEQDWLSFKSLFEKIYPGFFVNLKDRVADITLAEQRMAALIRLQLTSKQMASMLGISVDSVHKTRQRLRQRLHLSTEVNLEEYVAGV